MRLPLLSLRQIARWGGTSALILAPALAVAQDGQPPVGPPVTNPKTDKLLPREETSAPRPRTSADVLPPVPATAADPAPPGTRAVRVDEAIGGPSNPAPRGVAVRGARPVPGVMVAEGVVTRIDPPEDNVPGELLRFAFDPSQDWFNYISLGPSAAPPKKKQAESRPEKVARESLGDTRPDRQIKKKLARDADAAEKEAAKDNEDKADEGPMPDIPAPKEDVTNRIRPNRPKPLEMVVTRRTYIFTHARTPEGTDLYGVATQSSPDINSSLTGATHRGVAPVRAPMPTNFTNIKEGSFVSIRYRRVGNLNEILNLSLIEQPIDQPPDHTTGLAVPGVPAPGAIPGAPATPAAPVRVPRVPTQPVSIGTLPR